MLFSSVTFLFYFFPIVFIVYFSLSFSLKLQNIWLLLASLFFYAWGEPVYVFLMLISIIVNSIAGYFVERITSKKIRKIILFIVVVINMGALFGFKYLGYVLGGLSAILDIPMEMTLPTLPIGISFYTFQALSYVIDVYNKKTRAATPYYVGLYVAFFPQLIAGPIIQYSIIEEQIKSRKTSFDKVSIGISRFVVGMAKKVLLSNAFASIADNVFNWSAIGGDRFVVPVMLAWLGSIAYTLQIYFDFSAYSDMAIGLGFCFGFTFPENFNYPYIAETITDFWKRWHISLTSWFREYVYFPLGGNRVENQDKIIRNLFIVWLLTGIWHGANNTFIVWGMYYFIIQLAERFIGYTDKITKKSIRHLYTLLIVNFGWVIFRAQDIYQAGNFFSNMFGLNTNGFYSDIAVMLIRENFVQLLLGVVFSMPIANIVNYYFYRNRDSKLNKIATVIYPIVMLGLFILCVTNLVSGGYNPFIYFDF